MSSGQNQILERELRREFNQRMMEDLGDRAHSVTSRVRGSKIYLTVRIKNTGCLDNHRWIGERIRRRGFPDARMTSATPRTATWRLDP